MQKKPYCLYQGDCLEILKSLPESSVDLIFADPPYNLSNSGFTCSNGKKVSVNKGNWDKSKGFEEDYDFHLQWLEACKSVLKDSGTLWLSGTYHSIYQCGHALQKLDYHIINDIIWFKPNASPNLSCRMFTASHETLIWVKKNKKAKHIFHYEEMRQGDYPDDIIKVPEKQMRSVWCIGTPLKSEKTFGKHPTQKPVKLMERIIRSSSNEGDIILDPFAGSSTTGVAALKHKRRFVGIEKEQEYIELSEKRLQLQLQGINYSSTKEKTHKVEA